MQISRVIVRFAMMLFHLFVLSLCSAHAKAFVPQTAVTMMPSVTTSESTSARSLVPSNLVSSGNPSSTQLSALPISMATRTCISILRGGDVPDVDVSSIVEDSYDWCVNLGAPAALVAGAVIATIYENISSGALDVSSKDTKLVKFAKRLTRSLLISAFALEVLAIFVTTVTGTMLLSRPLDLMDEIVPVSETSTPLSFLRANFEFEYLTARVSFLQGLLNWLAAIGLSHIIPSGEKKSARYLNLFIGNSLFLTIGLMISFYNNHMTFFHNYAHMLTRWIKITMRRYIFASPFRPMMLVVFPMLVSTLFFGYKAFFYEDEDDDEDENALTT